MSSIRFGQQTYAWSMCGDKYFGNMDHMTAVTKKAGFEAIEPNNLQLGEFYNSAKLQETLEQHKVELSSLVLVCDWLHAQETDEEIAEANRIIELTTQFPGALLTLVQMPQADRNHLEERQKNLITCIHNVAQRATDKGLTCSYHPNSPDGSIWRTPEDYQTLLPQLDLSILKWTPDVGHIAKGGMDPVQMMRDYRDLINHVHYKDMYEDGRWAFTGEGCIDFETITKDLVHSNYQGWIIFEDECDEAIDDPDGVAIKDGAYIQSTVKSWLEQSTQAASS